MVGVPPSVTVSESRLPPPEAVVAVARILLVPVASVAVSFALCQVAQSPVLASARVPADVPLTVTATGRSVVPPLAYRKLSVTVPALLAGTENST